MDLAFSGVSGFAEVDFRLNNLGKLDSIDVITFPDLRLAKEIANVLVSTKELWTPTKLNGNNIEYKYKIIVEYKLIQGQNVPKNESAILRDKAEKMFNKQKFNDALEAINNAIKLDPFDYRYYDLRSKIFLKIGDMEKKERDKETSIKLEKQIVGCIVVIAYGIAK
jgi:tetratricopeptide (TPR) repeat protein